MTGAAEAAIMEAADAVVACCCCIAEGKCVYIYIYRLTDWTEWLSDCVTADGRFVFFGSDRAPNQTFTV